MRTVSWFRPNAILLAAPLLAPVALHGQPAPLAGLDAYIESALADWEIPGLAIAVVRADSVIFAKGYGVTELGRPERVDENTLFAIASTTKALTTAALGVLVDEGSLSWDDPVSKHLPDLALRDPWVTREITVRDLITHRAGLARYDNLWIAAPFEREGILRRVRWLPTADGFRDRYGYNNIMFIIAGEVVAAVSRMSWDDFVEERLFRPLDMMRSTTRAAVVETIGNVAASHTRVDGVIRAVPRRDYDNIGGAGAAFSSVADMANWVRMHLAGGRYEGRRILSDSVIREMHSAQTVMRTDSTGRRMFPSTHFRAYGLGWFLQDYQGRLLVNHSGSINYTRTQVGLMPEEGIGVVVIANLSSSTLQLALMYRVLDALMGVEPTDWSEEYLALARRSEERAAAERRRVEDDRLTGTKPSLDLSAYAGTYADSLFGEITVARGPAGLVLDYSPDYVADLEHWHQDVFRARWRRPGAGTDFVRFAIDERARVTAMEVDGLTTFGRKRAPGDP